MAKKGSVKGPSRTQGRQGGRQQEQGQDGPDSNTTAAPRGAEIVSSGPGPFPLEQAIVGASVAAAAHAPASAVAAERPRSPRSRAGATG